MAVINGTAIIGNNVNISQCSTIGSNSGHAAWIGNNVYIIYDLIHVLLKMYKSAATL